MGLLKRLKFGARPKQTAIIAAEGGGLGATIRFEDEKDITEEDRLQCVDAETEEQFLEARVVHVEKVPMWRALDIVKANGATYGIQYNAVLLEVLNSFYDTPISPVTPVKVIIYEPDPTSR